MFMDILMLYIGQDSGTWQEMTGLEPSPETQPCMGLLLTS